MSAPAMNRWTLAFDDPELERDYRASRSARWGPYAVALALTTLSWIAQGVWASVVVPVEVDLVWRAVGIISVFYGTALFAPLAVPARLRRRALTGFGLASWVLAAFTLIALTLEAGEPLARYARMGIGLYLLIGHTFVHGQFVRKQVVTWTVVLAWLIIVGAIDQASFPDIVDGAYWILVGQLTGSYVVYTTERQSRRTFLQKRLTERERKRADIAERARHLAEALLRVSGAAAHELAVGAILEEKYRVLRELGKGGMGAVYEVERISDGKRLALKVLRGAADREALARFAREAQIAAQLDHPNLVSVLDVDVSKAGTLFLVMELVAGGSLANQSARFGDVAWARPILRQIAAALEAMHARGIVHRDLKPANVLLDGELVRVADFGLASLADRPRAEAAGGEPSGQESTVAAVRAAMASSGHESTVASTPSLTRAGAFMGTPMYMAPEVGRDARQAAPPCDVFALGIIAYELLSGKSPFDEPPAVMQLEGRTPSRPPVLEGELGALVDRCLSFDPAARPSAAEVVAELN